MGPIGLPVDLQDDRPIDYPVQEGHRQRRIPQVVPPGREVNVRHQRRRALARAGVDDLVQQVGRLRRVAPLDLLEAKFIDHQQIETGVIPDPFRQGLVRQRRRQVDQQRGAGRVADRVAQHARRLGDRLDQERLAHPRLPDEHQVVLAPDEGAAGQFLDLCAVDGLSIELPVERTQRLAFAEAGLADAMGDTPFAAAVRLLGDEPVQEVLVRQALPLGVGQDRVELLGRERHLEGGEVGQDAFTQVGRGRRRDGVGRWLRAG